MIGALANIAAECVTTPRRSSVWAPRLGKYVCSDTTEGRRSFTDDPLALRSGHPAINPQFKLVFLAAAGGTVLFALICAALLLIAGGTPRPLEEKIIMGFFDLAKIGFGAIVGLLGGKQIQGGPEPTAI